MAEDRSEKLSLMQRFGLFFYDRREITLLYFAVFIIFGLLSYTVFMQRQGFPAVDVPVSVVNGTYFVQDRTKVDTDIALPASRALVELPEVEQITSQTGDNFFVLIIQYQEGVTSKQGNALVEKTLKDKKIFPAAAQTEFKPINATKFANEYDLLISVYDDKDSTSEQLTATAERVADGMSQRDGIDRVAVLKQLETGTDPRTGKTATELRHFDRVGVREGRDFNFYPSATIGIVGSANGDALKLSDDVHTAIEAIKQEPGNENTSITVAADFAEGVRDQIQSLQRSLLEGLAVVLLICFLLISWRASLTAAIAMLSVMLVTIGILYLTGNTLNTITMFALILSLGLIVDDTIIKVDAIDAAKAESRRKREIVALAAKRVSLASVAGTITTMLAFAPMLFVGGVLGDFIRIMPITVIIGLAMSLLVSLVLVPIISSNVILRKRPERPRNPVLKAEAFVSGGLAKLVLVSKRSRVKGSIIAVGALSIAVVMVGASFPFFQKLQFNIFPTTKDTNSLQASITFPQLTSIQDAQKYTDEINERIEASLGTDAKRVSYMNSGSSTDAIATIDLISYTEREATSPQLVEKLQTEFDDYKAAQVKIDQIDVGPPEEELPFRVQVYSEDDAKASVLASDIVAFLSGRSIDRQNGTTAKITRAEIANPTQTVRIDGQKVTEARAGFDANDTSALVVAAQNEVQDEFTSDKLAGYGLAKDALKFDFGTESENQESFSTLLIAFPILLGIMYFLMVFQFKSFLQPLLIFMAIPFSFFGVATGLYLSDNSLSFFVMVGFFALIGIALNNTILLTDYANQARKDGMGRVDATAYAIKARFRPLITTSLTSVVALVPLALSDPFWESLSFTLIFGLLSSTFLVIVAFPYIYLGGEILRALGHTIWQRQLPKVVQYPVDILISPVRLAAFILHGIFRHKPGESL